MAESAAGVHIQACLTSIPLQCSVAPGPATIPHTAPPRKRSGKGWRKLVSAWCMAAAASGSWESWRMQRWPPAARSWASFRNSSPGVRWRTRASPNWSSLNSMHSRKQRMFEAADAFISLPGGLGTLDETIEIITWRQLRLHAKPILICDVAGSAAPFLATIEAAIDADFALPETQRLYEVLESVPDVLQRLSHLHRVASSEAARL